MVLVEFPKKKISEEKKLFISIVNFKHCTISFTYSCFKQMSNTSYCGLTHWIFIQDVIACIGK